MSEYKSKIDPTSTEYQQNAEINRALADDLHRIVAAVNVGGPDHSRQKHVDRGKLLPRDRVHKLLDTDSGFLEIGGLAAHGVYEDELPGAGLICGIGRIDRTRWHILSVDRQETPPRSGDCARESSSLSLPG
jgi:3-methylcrotonyl-CoA carboxylase beta subunit